MKQIDWDLIDDFHQRNDLGVNFTLVTAVENGTNSPGYQINFRKRQPCMGELRKYKAVHGEECTQPWDHRPMDLFDPFPVGKPVGFAMSRIGKIQDGVPAGSPYLPTEEQLQTAEKYARVLFDKSKSPWAKGLPSKGIEFIRAKNPGKIDDGRIIGVTFRNGLDLEPTALVNLSKQFYSLSNPTVLTLMKKLEDEYGFTVEEQVRWSALLNYINIESPYPMGCRAGQYPNLKAAFTGDSVDFCGGTLENRYDYCRKGSLLIFAHPKETEVLIDKAKEQAKRGKSGYIATEPIEIKDAMSASEISAEIDKDGKDVASRVKNLKRLIAEHSS